MDLTITAAQAAERVRSGEIPARELVAAALDRIDAVNPALNAVVEVRGAAALAEAESLPEDRRGQLEGVPITVKESFHVAGFHSTWGLPDLRDFIADRDATVVARLRAAGAIVVGTTNVATMLSDLGQSDNPLYGPTRNPWAIDHTPGGSSGGAAAAVAAGLSFMDYGSDLAGSVRIPASFCGVYGLRPTAGTVPVDGLTPGDAPAIPKHLSYLGTVGPIARSAADLRVALRATAGPTGPAARANTWSLAAPKRTRLRDFRIGVVLDHALSPVTGEVGAVLSDTVDALAKAGVSVVEGWPEGIDVPASLDTFGRQLALFFAYQQPDPDAPSLAEMIALEHRRIAFRAAWEAYFADVDVLVCPTSFTAAFPHDPRPQHERNIVTAEGERPYSELGFWIAHASLAGLPALSAPVGKTPGGLPVGAQVHTARHADDTAITFAELMAGEVGGYEPPARWTSTS